MKKRCLGGLMMITFLLSSCGVQAITEEEAIVYMRDIRQKQEEEGFAFPHRFTIENVWENQTENAYEKTNIVLDEEAKYCYSSKKRVNVSDDTTDVEKWVYVKENQCIVATSENGISSYQIYTGDLDALWVTYSNEIRNEAKEWIQGTPYLYFSFYQNDPQIFEDKTLFYDDHPKIRYNTKGAGSLMISFFRSVIEKIDENVNKNIGKVTYQITFNDDLLQKCIKKGQYTKENITQLIEEKTKVEKYAKLDYPVLSEF